MKQFKIKIPKPCHEDWNKMTPKEKGRFCTSCAKTVVDFTQKSTQEIQDYLVENHGNRVCGHFYRKQLDSIVLQVPETTFQQQLPFQKLFILSLLFVMGTTLFSCKTDAGKVQKIDRVELIDTIVKTEKTIDTITKQSCLTVGEIPVAPTKDIRDSLPKIKITGDLIIDDGEVVLEPIEHYSINLVDTPPRFKETKLSSKGILQKEFNKKMQDFVVQNFDFSFTNNLNLSKGKKRIQVGFLIDDHGNTDNIQVRAPHPFLKKKAIEIFEKLPNFIPAKKDNEYISIYYVQLITFVVE